MPICSFCLRASTDGPVQEGYRWSNPNYSQADIDSWYYKLDKSLLTIGSNGLKDTHINSLRELLVSHEHVRVKIATDKINIQNISNQMVTHPDLVNTADLLSVRKREFMVGRKPSST